jgi:hypothetical protein
VFHGIGATFGYFGFEDFGDWVREPVFWYGIVAPVALLVIATLYLFWLDRKAAKLCRPELKRKSGWQCRQPTRENFAHGADAGASHRIQTRDCELARMRLALNFDRSEFLEVSQQTEADPGTIAEYADDTPATNSAAKFLR